MAKKTQEERLYEWCLEQASARYMGLLSPEQEDKLNSIDFPWAFYEEELDKLGYSWKKNNPDGVRFKDIEQEREDLIVNDYLDRERDHYEEPEELVDPEQC